MVKSALTYLLLLLIIGLSLPVMAQSQEEEPKPKLVIKPTLVFQLWGSYTEGQQLYNTTTQAYDAVDNRLNFQLHRSRMGIKGSYGDRWVYDMTGSLDFVGQDALAGTVGAFNNGASPRFRIWNALVQYKITKASEGLYMTFGHQGTQLSRESITSPFAVGSFEKSWSQNYIRRHAIGNGPGRTMGIILGGMSKTQNTQFAVDYNFGLHNPVQNALGGTSSGINYSPLLTYRLGVHLGDPEYAKYSRGHKFNYKGQRNGVTLAISGSYQGETDTWETNTSFGIDILANYGPLNLSGEWMQLNRSLDALESSARTGFLKLGYYMRLANGKELEPIINYVFLDGAMDEREQVDARTLGTFFGKDNYLELTLNYYATPKIRWSLSYTLREGDAGDIDPTLVNNNFYQQGGGVGPIQKGNFLGVGLLFSI